MKKREEKSSSKPIIVAGIIVTLALIMGVSAKYLMKFLSDTGEITADKFYFTSDLLGDQTMMPTSGEISSNYQYEDVQKGEWHLYGGGAHEISFAIRNYADEKRVTQTDIVYTANVIAQAPDGKEIEGLVTLKSGENTNGTESLDGILSRTTQNSNALTLSVKSSKDVPYAEGTKVIVTVESQTPYKKTMEFDFLLYTVDTYLSYAIKDSVNSPYAELFIMTNIVDGGSADTGGVQPYLKWTSELSIDNTNSLTYTNEGTFQPQVGIKDRNMQISRELKAGESESIYFFKSNPKENYTTEQTRVGLEDDRYTINIDKKDK